MVYPKFIKKAKGTTTIGLTLHANSAHYANSLGSCGWDWLVVDLPNSSSDFRDVFNQLTGMGDTGTTAPLIRVGGPNDRSGIQQATDQGAAGVLVPNVRSAAEARKARGVTLYPNAYKTDVRGTRSFIGPTRAHNRFGMPTYLFAADKLVFTALQLEKAAMADWASILAEDFDCAILDIPQLCVQLGLFDQLLASPPTADSLPGFLDAFVAVYSQPKGKLHEALSKFVSLCRKAGKVPGCLLGEHTAAATYQSLGFKFLGCGSELTLMLERAVPAITKQADNAGHPWKPKAFSVESDKARSAKLPALLKAAAFQGFEMLDSTYESVAAVRDAPVVFLDGLSPGASTPQKLERMLYALDGEGARLVRVQCAEEESAPFTAAVALSAGADSVFAPVSTAAQAAALMAAKDFKQNRYLAFGPTLPSQVVKTTLAGVELLAPPPAAEKTGILSAADFVVCSVASWGAACGGDPAGTFDALTKFMGEVSAAAKPFVLLVDGPALLSEAQLATFPMTLVTAPPVVVGAMDAAIEATNAKVEAAVGKGHAGEPCLGTFFFGQSPKSAAALIDAGFDWVLMEWQHAPLEHDALKACCDAIHQRGGLAFVRVAGYHDRIGIAQSHSAGVDVCLIPYINTREEATEAILHCQLAPEGDRAWNGKAITKHKRMRIMFQYETWECMDNLADISKEPLLDFGFVGPGDLAMSMGLHTRDTVLGMMKGKEMQWCYKHIVKTCLDAGKIPGGFTRGGDPSKLLAHGFSTVCLGMDLFFLMLACESIFTGKISFPAPEKTGIGMTKVKRKKNFSRLVISSGYLRKEMLPGLISYLWRHSMNKPKLSLPKVVALAQEGKFEGVIDMEAETKTKGGTVPVEVKSN